jgi:hypothetical protein
VLNVREGYKDVGIEGRIYKFAYMRHLYFSTEKAEFRHYGPE